MLNLKLQEKAPFFIRNACEQALHQASTATYTDSARHLEAVRGMIQDRISTGTTSYMASIAGRTLNVWRMRAGQNIPLATIERDETPSELARNHNGTIDAALRTLRGAYESGRAAVRKVVESSKADQAMYVPGEFARQVSWGYAVAEDLIARRAETLLAAIDECRVTVAEALAYEIDEVERELLRNSNRPTSTNPFSNAVEIAKVAALSHWLESIRRDARWIANARAEMEVL
jgi:hypothetical protein